MDDPFARLIEAARQVTRTGQLTDAERLRDETSAMQGALAERLRVPATATDPRGLVEATVRYDGTVDEVHISARAMRDLDNDALGQACVAAILAGRSTAATQVAAWIQPEPEPAPAPGESHGWES
jgi:DNA-binding protein YbaB